MDELVELLSRPREAGTPDCARAREAVRRRLEQLGYAVEVQRFTFPPSSLRAFPLFGAGLGWLTLLLLPLVVWSGPPRWAALACWIAGLSGLTVLVAGLGLGWVAPGGLREDANLVAVRPGAPVRRWIVAHLDTKAQGHSMAGRLAAVWLAATAVLALSVLVMLRLGGPIPLAWAAPAAGLAVVAGFLASRGRLRGSSPGARDNGSGMLGALAAAEVSHEPDVGILITGAEEFGLVGARVFARFSAARVAGTEVVNLDTLDDEGTLYVVSHNAAGAHLGEVEAARLRALEIPLQFRRLPLGIFVDSHPLARAGAAAVTIGRLTWATLRRIHTPRDTAEGLSFETARRVGQVIGAPR